MFELTRNFMDYEAVFGLETHAQLKTKSPMCCRCADAFRSPPKTNVCPFCLGCPACCSCPTTKPCA